MSPKLGPKARLEVEPPQAAKVEMAEEAAPPPERTLTLPLSHGGSGPFGNSAYKDRATGCLEYQRLKAEHPLPCEEVYKPGAGGKPNAMLVGSMVHAYGEQELKHGQDSLPPRGTPVQFVDDECQWSPPENAIEEAHRVYWGWVDCRQRWGEGKTIGVELFLEADLGKGWDFPIIAQAKIDHLVLDPDGVLCLEDLKTSATSKDSYSTGNTRLQMHLYTMIAWANGHNVQRIRIRQIVKTKTVQENLYETIDLPDPAREAWIVRYLQGAAQRAKNPQPGPWGAGCDFCPYAKNFKCKL